jgi:hypothetical protein
LFLQRVALDGKAGGAKQDSPFAQPAEVVCGPAERPAELAAHDPALLAGPGRLPDDQPRRRQAPPLSRLARFVAAHERDRVRERRQLPAQHSGAFLGEEERVVAPRVLGEAEGVPGQEPLPDATRLADDVLAGLGLETRLPRKVPRLRRHEPVVDKAPDRLARQVSQRPPRVRLDLHAHLAHGRGEGGDGRGDDHAQNERLAGPEFFN